MIMTLHSIANNEKWYRWRSNNFYWIFTYRKNAVFNNYVHFSINFRIKIYTYIKFDFVFFGRGFFIEIGKKYKVKIQKATK
tara:strand:+ start:1816 stop:2058 length:243 start_codon:yes stop_codon:yes gene_type:complete